MTKIALVFQMVVFITACSIPRSEQSILERFIQPDEIRGATGTNGFVVGTTSKGAILAGLDAIQEGGSAVDGALVTTLAQVAGTAGNFVTLAGIMSMLVYESETGLVYSMNAAYDIPGGEDDPYSIPTADSGVPSGRTALVPGFMAGVNAAHERFGKLPFERLFSPAIKIAEEGFVLNDLEAKLLSDYQTVLSRLPETKAQFFKPDGTLYQTGDLFRQPALAGTLKAVASDGAGYMYHGPWAEKFVETIQQEGGKITLEDMESYRVIWTDPGQTTYRGHEIYGPGLPGIGGVNAIEAFNLLELADLPQYGHYSDSPEALFWLMQILRMSLLSQVLPDEIISSLPATNLSFSSRLTKETSRWIWDEIRSGSFPITDNTYQVENSHSAAVIAVDGQGNIAALVHTSNAYFYGNTGIAIDGVYIPDSASFQQGMMAKTGPGNRLPDPTNPMIVLKEGQPIAASSCIGSIHYESIQRLVNLLDFGMNPEEALKAPLLLRPNVTLDNSTNKLLFTERLAEGEFSENIIKGLNSYGVIINEQPRTFESMISDRGYWIGVAINPWDGTITGAVPGLFGGNAAGY